MKDPVILDATGYSYEREALQKWIEEEGTDLKTGLALTVFNMTPNTNLKHLIERVNTL